MTEQGALRRNTVASMEHLEIRSGGHRSELSRRLAGAAQLIGRLCQVVIGLSLTNCRAQAEQGRKVGDGCAVPHERSGASSFGDADVTRRIRKANEQFEQCVTSLRKS